MVARVDLGSGPGVLVGLELEGDDVGVERAQWVEDFFGGAFHFGVCVEARVDAHGCIEGTGGLIFVSGCSGLMV